MEIRRADGSQAEVIGRLLHDFNTEYGEPTPGAPALAERIAELLDGGGTAVLLAERDADGEADGLAVLRFRPAIWARALECYVAELYVVPDRRGRGIGRALMKAAIELARSEGAAYMDLGTSEADVAARGLYESLGFSNREGDPDGPINFFYELEL
jgi:ribosomal protein S18 acetylase RimI-like enzyme